MSDTMDHGWVRERMGAAVTGGLSAAEQAAFDAHVHGCAECFDAYTEAREADRAMQRAVSGLAPSEKFEAELLNVIREKSMHRRFRVAAKRVGMGLAAAVALVVSGVSAEVLIHRDTLNNPVTKRLAGEDSGFLPEGLQRLLAFGSRSEPATLHGIAQSEAIYANANWPSRDELDVDDRHLASAHNYDYPEMAGKDGSYLSSYRLSPDAGEKSSNQPEAKANPHHEMGFGYSYGIRTIESNGRLGGSGSLGSVNPWMLRVHDVPAAAFEENQRLAAHNAELSRQNNELLTTGKFAEQSIRKMQEEVSRLESAGGTGNNAVVRSGAGNLVLNGGTVGVGGKQLDGQDVGFADAHVDYAQKPQNAPVLGNLPITGIPFKDGNEAGERGDKYKVKGNEARRNYNYFSVADVEKAANKRTLEEQNKPVTGKLSDDQEHLLPYTDLMVYPSDWVELSRDRFVRASSGTVDANGNMIASAGDNLGDAHKKGTFPVQATTLPASAAPLPAPPQPQITDVAPRKVIRNGVVEFEVRSFDDATLTITTVVEEEKGYVSTTSSEKLANGKIQGLVVVRVPPERLDRLVLKLRALGELKSQHIAATDVSKQYTDIESELKALRAMEGRLIDLVKNGKGEVKDLVEAEKQLGEYRVRIEKLEGEIRYYNNLVGMATLTIKAYEKDIQKPTAASEQESVTLALETEDVEAKYKDARKILEDAKGRIVESELKKHDADQYSAHIVVDVPPDQADSVAAQLKQIGRVQTFNRDRRQTTTGGQGAPEVKVEQKETRFTITLFNLANVAPRETTVLTVAVKDVEASYRQVLGLVRGAGRGDAATRGRGEAETPRVGRVVTSNLSGQQADQMTADVRADVRAEEADAVVAAIRATGEVLTSAMTENPDTANVTSSKRGVQLRLVNVAQVPAREVRTMRLVAASVPETFGKVLGALADQGPNVRITNSQLNENSPRSITAVLGFEVRREALPAVEKAFADAGIDYLSRNIARSSDTANTLDSKVRFQVDELVAAESLAPRRTTMLGIEVDDVEKAMESVRGSLPKDRRELVSVVEKEPKKPVLGHLVVEVATSDVPGVLMKIRAAGGVEKMNRVAINSDVADTKYSKERIDVVFSGQQGIVQAEKGLGATVKAALSTAVGALLYSLYLIIIGVLFVGPWVAVMWLFWKVSRRRKATAT